MGANNMTWGDWRKSGNLQFILSIRTRYLNHGYNSIRDVMILISYEMIDQSNFG
jgi:hypothetical protein